MTQLWQLSATELTKGFRDRRWTPVEALASIHERLHQINPTLNAVVQLSQDALEAAQQSSERYATGTPIGPLDGVPISIKDNLVMAGGPTTWGTLALKEWVSQHDELPVQRLREAGAVLFAKTNTPEFTLEGYTSNPVYGVTVSPWDINLTPGGSSGGAAAAVAAGIGPLALGTDGGGSIRRPAAHCGLVGLKPSIGRIARGEGLPQLLLDLEVVGPIARCVEDAELLLNVLEGSDCLDRRSQVLKLPSDRKLTRLLCITSLDGQPVDPQIRQQVEAATDRFEQLGMRVERTDFPLDLASLNDAWSDIGKIGLAQLAQTNPDWIAQASPKYREMAEAGTSLPSTKLWQLLNVIDELRNQVDGLFTRTDVVLMPSIAALSWPADEPYPPMIDGQPVGPRGHAVFTGWVNAAGNPAISLPAGLSREGLPIGLQLIGPWQADHLLLALAARYQHDQPWQHDYRALWQ